MSDMWQVPEGLAESLLKKDPCAEARNDAWANGVEAGKEYVGRMMMDLIEELKNMPDYGVTGEFLSTLAGMYEWRLKEAIDE